MPSRRRRRLEPAGSGVTGSASPRRGGGEEVGQSGDAERRLALRLGEDKGHPAGDRGGDDVRLVRHLRGRRRLQEILDVAALQLAGSVPVVDDQHEASRVDLEHPHDRLEQPGVLHPRRTQVGDHQDLVGHFDEVQADLAEVGGGVHHDAVVGAPQLLDQGPQVLGGDVIGQLGADRRGQHPHAAGPVHHHLLDHVVIRHRVVGRQVGDGALGRDVQEDADVAELQRAVQQGHPPGAAERDGEVGRDRRFSHPSLGADHGEELAPGRGCGAGAAGRRGRRGPFTEPVGVHAADRGHQLVATEGLLQELAGPGQHGPPEGLVLGLHGEQDDARVGQVLHQHLGGLDAVHAGEPGVHHGHLGLRAQCFLEGRVAVSGDGADGEVLLLAESLAQVLDDAGRFVGKEDADHGMLLSRARVRIAGG